MTASLPGMSNRGTWSNAITYRAQDVVEFAGASYVAIASNTNSMPPSASWAGLGSGGSGPQGPQGPQGTAGNDERAFFMS